MFWPKKNPSTLTASSLLTTLAVIIFPCLIIFIQMQAPSFFPKQFGSLDLRTTFSFIYFIAIIIFFFLAIPVAISSLTMKEHLSQLGLRKPEKKLTAVFLTILALSMLMPCMIYFTKLPSFQAYYFLGKLSVWRILFVDCLMMPIYYFCEEFFFRGYLFLSLYRRVGWHSFWITDIIFTFSHINKPGLEFLLSIPASVIFNFITLKTKSIYPAFIVHTAMGIVLNILIAINVSNLH